MGSFCAPNLGKPCLCIQPALTCLKLERKHKVLPFLFYLSAQREHRSKTDKLLQTERSSGSVLPGNQIALKATFDLLQSAKMQGQPSKWRKSLWTFYRAACTRLSLNIHRLTSSSILLCLSTNAGWLGNGSEGHCGKHFWLGWIMFYGMEILPWSSLWISAQLTVSSEGNSFPVKW